MTGSERHAFLVLAHRDQQLLEVLLSLLDHSANDIYLHVDRRSTSLDLDRLGGLVRRADLVCIRRRPVHWGAFSMVEAELSLLGTASRDPHAYYHLISGADLPLVDQDTLRAYFHAHQGREFIHYAGEAQDRSSEHRVTRRHLFARRGGPARSQVPMAAAMDRVWSKVQAVGNVDQVRRSGATPRKGSQWFSITHELARYVVDHEPWIRRTFRHSVIPDEFFLQTLVSCSPFADRLFSDRDDDDHWACARKIDWRRGSPYTWRISDLPELRDAARTGHVFARKFDSDVDPEVIQAVREGLDRG